MYLWNVNRLAHVLRQNEIKQVDVFKSFLFLTGLYVIQSQLTSILKFNASTSLLTAATTGIINVTIAIVGITWMYNVNKDGDDNNFVERYICLAVPISIQVIVINILLYVIYLFVLGIADKYFEEYVPLQLIANCYSLLQLLTLLYFFILMRRYLRFVSTNSA